MPIKKKYRDNPEINKLLSEAWLNIRVKDNELPNPLDWPPEYADCPYKYITWIMSQPEYFAFLCDQILNVKILPMQAVILKTLWNSKFPILVASRGAGKTFLLGVYCILRMLLMPNRKLVLAGAVFRQSKFIFEYMERIWYNAPLLRDIVGSSRDVGPHHDTDHWTFDIGNSKCTAIPLGDGTRIRGERANDLITDEFASVPQEIFEIVLQGFASVKSHPIDGVIEYAANELAKKMDLWDDTEEELDNPFMKDNQIVISGTAHYDFTHFGTYWKEYRNIILSKGDKKVLEEILSKRARAENKEFTGIDPSFNWKDYAIIRIPIEIIPKGFMDMAVVSRAKATSHLGIYQMEYGAIFSKDSSGFFKRTLIESCVASPTNNIVIPTHGQIIFGSTLYGNKNLKYIYGIDPASEVDKFSIVVLELWPDHQRVVYAWSTERKQHAEEQKAGLTKETDFFAYCARKIRWLMERFPCERIMMDSQGGGVPILEALHDESKFNAPIEKPIWEVIDSDEKKDSDTKFGHHLIEMVNFADYNWTCEANHGLRKDMEDKILLFPYLDTLALSLLENLTKDEPHAHIYDNLEDCAIEIQHLQDELSTITITKTPNGKDHWDTPETKLPGGKKGRLRKDRYSALVMANMGARQLMRNPNIPIELPTGGFAQPGRNLAKGQMYSGNDFYDAWAREVYR